MRIMPLEKRIKRRYKTHNLITEKPASISETGFVVLELYTVIWLLFFRNICFRREINRNQMFLQRLFCPEERESICNGRLQQVHHWHFGSHIPSDYRA